MKAWVSEGAGLAEVQKKLVELLDTPMTYMEVRFLVDDLGLELQSPEPEAKGTAAKESEAAMDLNGGGSPGKVSVSVSKIQRPGAVMGGSVTFSDGVSAEWHIDSMGRLGIVPPKEGYQPSAEDLREFQMALQSELQSQGM